MQDLKDRELLMLGGVEGRVYQGIAIIADPDEGQCITFYGDDEKRDYDLDIKDGKLLDGRKILAHKWLDSAVDQDEIKRVARQIS